MKIRMDIDEKTLQELWKWRERKNMAARYFRAYVKGTMTGTLRKDFSIDSELIGVLTEEEKRSIIRDVIRELTVRR